MTAPTRPAATGTEPPSAAAGPSGRGPGTAPPWRPSRRPSPDTASGRALLACGAGLMLACLAQSPGRLVADTKLDLVVNPLGFLGRALHLWDPSAGLGQLQNQAQGYLFPVGPVFALAHGAGMPMWVVQRLWMGVLLGAACWGTARLADSLGVGTPGTRVAAGLVYALSPPVLGLVGPLSALVLPAAMAPWALLPLVRGSRSGSPVRAASRSGVAIALMGAVNSGATLAVLGLPVLWLATRSRGPRRRAMVRWWAVAVALACGWWAVSLVVGGRYAFGFLGYIERAATTAAAGSAPEALRGTASWLGHYVAQGQPWWPGAWLLAAAPAAVAASAGLVAVGLVGLAHRRLPEQRFLVVTLLAGLALTAAGYAGPFGGPLAGHVRGLLDGPLVAFRSISKFEPLVALPLALGVAHALAVLRPTRREQPIVVALVGMLLAGIALPLLRGQLAPEGSFSGLPHYWSEASAWLGAHADGNRALLVPASGFGEYQWGRPLDEPLQALARSPWVVRNQAPLGSPGSTRVLDAVEDRLVAGRPSPGLAAFLARAGIAFVVVRNDLDWLRAGAPDPRLVGETLAATPGIRPAAAFGPVVEGALPGNGPAGPGGRTGPAGPGGRTGPAGPGGTAGPAGPGGTAGPAGPGGRAGPAGPGGRTGPAGPGGTTEPVAGTTGRAVEVYRVEGEVARVVSYPVDGTTVLSGGPEGLLQLADRAVLDGAVVLAGDRSEAAVAPSRWAVTDGLRRRDVNFGLVHGGASYVLAADERVGGHDPRDRLPVSGPGRQTVAVMDGASAVRASSYATAVGPHPEAQPMAAFDGDPATAWQSGTAGSSQGQWVEVTLDRPREVGGLRVRLLAPRQGGPWVTRLRVTTDGGAVETDVVDSEDPQAVRVPAGATGRLRVTLVSVVGETTASLARAGLREVELPGIELRRPLSVPADEASRFSSPGDPAPLFAFDRDVADPRQDLRPDEEARLDRRFTVPRSAAFTLTGTARPTPDADLDALTGPGAAAVSLPCGKGPFVAVDGKVVATSVEGRGDDLGAGRELSFSACGGPLDLTAGGHRLEAVPGGPLVVTSATLAGEGWPGIAAPTGGPPAPAAGQSPRPVTVDRWASNHRTLRVAPGPGTFLALTESANRGWTARLGGHRLDAVRLDGWRQAWVVPAGAGGVVQVDFAPDGPYRLSLVLGAAGLAVLGLMAMGRPRSSGRPPVGEGRQLPLTVVAAAAALFVVGGPVALVVPAVLVAIRRPAVAPAVAGSAFAVAGLVEVLHPARAPGSGAGAFGWAAQLAALVAAGAVASVLARRAGHDPR